MGEAVSIGEQSAVGMEVEMKKNGCKDGSSSVVRWERFLPRMVVRVLLVESDDSTRQIISALLRKCNYKVAAVADGLRAWEVLKEKSRNIDLILTEIDLPSISGFALLSLIAEDDICKNIPVIIMSSHDSIGTVHKCMMRGAADFLMKPIRINELKNLWQHVWRRQSCQPAMGCGLSLQVESAAQPKVDEATAENDTVSDSSGSKTLLQIEEACFKKGSDAQSSCTNPSLEARSAYAGEESQGLSRTKKLKPPVGDTEHSQDDDGSGRNLCTRANIVVGSEDDYCKRKYIQGGKLEGHSPLVIGNDLAYQDSERTTTRAESSREAIDLIGAFDNKGSYAPSCPNNGPKIFESSELNLSWGGFQLTGLESNTNPKNVLIHSNVSAFSRYTSKQSQLMPRESTMTAIEHFPIHIRANYAEPKVVSSTYNRSVATLPVHHREEPEVSLPYEQQQRQYHVHTETRDANFPKHFGADRAAIIHEQRFMCIDEHERLEQLVERVDKKTRFSPATDQSGSDSFCNGAVTHTNWPGNMCASNGNVNPSVHPTIVASENGNVDERFLPLDKKTQREAALLKFRLKRKERCYEKKVRYESRKKLADQRPRVKGQFVRRIPPDPPPSIPEADYA